MSLAPSFSLHQSSLYLNEKEREHGLIGRRRPQDLLLMFLVQGLMKGDPGESGAFI